MTEDLFGNLTSDPQAPAGGSLSQADHANLPLAVRLRPRTLDEIVGQEHCWRRVPRCGG